MECAAQQFAAACFGEGIDQVHARRTRDGTQRAVDLAQNFLLERLDGFWRFQCACVLGCDEGQGHLAFEIVGHAYNARLGHVGVRRNALFDFTRAQAVAGHVDHVVGASKDEVIPVGIALGPIKRAIEPAILVLFVLYLGPVGVDEALVVAPDGLQATGRQRPLNHQYALLLGPGDGGAVAVVDEADVVAVYADAGAAKARGHGRHTVDAVDHAQNGPAGFGLPVVVHDWFFQPFVNPLRSGFVERLASDEQGAKAGEIVFLEVFRILLLEHADGRGRAEHDADVVFFHQAPPDAAVGLVVKALGGQALVHDRCHAANEWAINDVAVTHHPADVAGGKVGLTGFAAVDVGNAGSQRHAIAAGVALDALWFARGATGIERVTRCGGFEPHAGYFRIHVFGSHICPEMVASFDQVHWRQAAIRQQHRVGLVAGELNGFIEQGLVRNNLAATRPAVGTDNDLGLRIFNACSQRARGKAAKHHRMDRTDTRAGEHGETGFRNHRHVNQHPVALLDTQVLQDGGHALDFTLQLRKAVSFFGIGFRGDDDQRRIVRTFGGMAIHRVVAKIGGAANKPARKRGIAVIANLFRRDFPIDSLGLLSPESLGIRQRFLKKISINLHKKSPEN